jgi:chromate reductase, NAD(P)H dehydrogenase (quinone)
VRIVGLCGSLQASSSNLTLLRSVPDVLPDGAEFEIFDGIRDLPLFNPDIESSGSAPESVVRWRAVLTTADALLIASPEYGHSLPGSLKNAIDWVIGSAELDNKVVGVTASVNHESRGERGLDALLRTLTAVNTRIVGGTAIARGPEESARVRELVEAIAAAVAGAHIVDP